MCPCYVSRRYLRNCLLDCVLIAHTHPLGGVDVPFWLVMISNLLTLINGVGYH